MNKLKIGVLAASIAWAWPSLSFAETTPNEALAAELRELKARMADLEKRLAETEAKPAAGMTPDQQSEFNRIALKAEALEDSRDFMGLKGLKFSGYIDPSFVWNRDQDRAGFQFLNAIGQGGYSYDNGYFATAMLDLLKETDSGTRWHLTLAPNRGAGALLDGNSIVQEASVSLPLTDLQTRLIAGQIPDWSGYEFVPATQNKLVTHNLLFDFTLPIAYTGIGLDVLRGKWETKVMLANMNSTIRAPRDKAPVLAYRVDYSKGEFNGFGFAGVHGKTTNFASADLSDSRVDTFELDGYFIRGAWTVQGQLSVGRQKGAAITPDPDTGAARDAKWWGASALAAYNFTPVLAGIVRADYINNHKNGGGLLGYGVADDRNGIGPTADAPERGANRAALSLGLLYNFNLNTSFKLEFRNDFASQPVFLDVRTGAYRKHNQLLGGSMVVSF
ncbi:DUF3138 family protein [Pelomonas sp. KK5]|uniref:DUF3138 family protein n=1 Tax=Pelomonas sp. KK5 TaxID=1855730 RepID=UPI00097C18BC|nr:DUF3138 family protein [Pelomonas sp. KK5]